MSVMVCGLLHSPTTVKLMLVPRPFLYTGRVLCTKTCGLLGGPSLGGQSKKHTAQVLAPLQPFAIPWIDKDKAICRLNVNLGNHGSPSSLVPRLLVGGEKRAWYPMLSTCSGNSVRGTRNRYVIYSVTYNLERYN